MKKYFLVHRINSSEQQEYIVLRSISYQQRPVGNIILESDDVDELERLAELHRESEGPQQEDKWMEFVEHYNEQ